MKLKHDQNGLVHLWAVGLLLLAISVAGFAVYRIQPGSNTAASKLCSAQEKIEICVTQTTNKLSYTESTTLEVQVTNKGAQAHPYYDNCPGLPLVINGKDKLLSCLGTDNVKPPKSLEPGKIEKYDVMLDGVDLKEGSNEIQVDWSKLRSSKMNFTRLPLGNKDRENLEKCNEGDERPYCVSLNVILKEGYYGNNITCDDIAKYFADLELRPQKSQCGVAEIGVIYIIVPKGQEQQIKTKLEAIPQVKSVSGGN